VRDAYERLLTDILRGRLSLFLRRDEVEAQWAFIDRLRDELQELTDACQRAYPVDGTGQWWQPRDLGGTAPTPEEAAAADVERARRRDASADG